MRIVLTGSSGRIGRAVYNALARHHHVIGIDRSVFSTTRITADFVDRELLTHALQGADAVIQTAALHAPHVGVLSDREFHDTPTKKPRAFRPGRNCGTVRVATEGLCESQIA